jgi:hypothetical protein
MEWSGIASIVFVCVTMNHLGLIKAIEENTGYEFPILDCPKCSSFWFTLLFSVVTSRHVLTPLAVSFLASYTAIWLELLEGYIDTLYLKLYGKIYENSNDTTASDADNGNSAGTMSQL